MSMGLCDYLIDKGGENLLESTTESVKKTILKTVYTGDVVQVYF